MQTLILKVKRHVSAMHTLRWLLTVPAGIAGFYIGVIVALLAHMGSEWLCPSEYVVSGTCFAPWSTFVNDTYLALGALICGSLTVLLPTLIAPSHRCKVAYIAYASGLTGSVYWLAHSLWVPVAWAVLAGAITIWRIQIFHQTRL